ncbi:vitamin K epoxide reductase family protein [Nesterenkonia haasae]|uniref:vitamin K epoxide reductase family protein n=1 Tax=Nesterenkonia haasae TaxID=2587813 RepID=UPI001F3154EA|nr:vitamin K epoxide reductase family protein [Nesterenkonia haasae]
MSMTLDAQESRSEDSPGSQSAALNPGRVLPAFARPFGFAMWLLATGIVGALASFLLLYERVRLWNDPEHVTACDVNPWVSCGEVMQTWQASTFGFPNIFLGVVGFPLLIGVAVTLLAIGGRVPSWYYMGLQVGVLFAFGFSTWLWYSAVFSIGVLCPYCMIVWAAVIPMFVVTTARNIMHGVIPGSEGLKRMTREWWWVAVVVIYLLVIGSILLNFSEAVTSAF